MPCLKSLKNIQKGVILIQRFTLSQSRNHQTMEKTNLSMLLFRSHEHNTKSGGTQGLKDFGDTFKGFLAQDWLHRPENLKCFDRFQKQVSS